MRILCPYLYSLCFNAMYLPVFVGILIPFLTTKHAASSHQYIVLKGKSMPPTIYETYTESMTICAAHCSSNNECSFASYNSATGLCATSVSCGIEIGNSFTSVLMKIPESALCETNWYPFNGKCYYFEVNKLKWQDAQNNCQLKGSNLVKIEDTCEHEWIVSVLTENEFQSTWIGATDMSSQGTWIWASDNTGLTYTYWDVADNEPDNKGGVEDCAIMRQSANFQWYDRYCLYTYSYICEKLV